MFESASKERFSLSVFNLGRLNEIDKKFNESIQNYIKAIEYENEPLIFHNHFYYDEQLEISKSFIVCYLILRFCLKYLLENQFELSLLFFINAIFKPLFKFLFNNDFQSYSFRIKIDSNQDKSIKTNFSDLILNFPIFNISNQLNVNYHGKSNWTKIENSNLCSKEINLYIETVKKDNPNNNNVFIKKEENETKMLNFHVDIKNKNDDVMSNNISNETDKNQVFERSRMINEINNIFNYYNNNKKFKKIVENQEDDVKEFIFANLEHKDERKLKYPLILIDFISKNIKDMKMK